LVLGYANPLEFLGRLSALEFTDSAAAVTLRVVVDTGPAAVGRGATRGAAA
jgi:hypothetical protein